MKYLKRFNQINEGQNNSDIERICRKYKIKNYKINTDGSVDVDGNVDLSRKNLTKLPLQFGKVTGDFNCSYNQLASLEGGPNEVGDFNCGGNGLTSLVGAPQKVGGYFYCHDNRIKTFEGCPEIKTFEGLPEIRLCYFICDGNPINVIYKLFKSEFKKFIDKINFIYTDFFNGPDMIRGDVLEQIAEELKIELPTNWESQLVAVGYTII